MIPAFDQLLFSLRAVLAGASLCTGVAVPLRGAEGGPDARAAATGGGTARSFAESPPPRNDSSASDTLPVYLVPYAPPPLTASFDDQLEFERERLLRDWTDAQLEPQPIYFPPAPPVLGAPLPGVGLFADDVVRALAPYVSEPFYAPLSTRFAEEDFGRRVRTRLEGYRSDKTALLEALRARLEELRDETPGVRRVAMAEFADVQDPAIATLERTADELRREFFRTRFLGGGGDWNQYRVWRLEPAAATNASAAQRLRELRVLRAAVYYQEGLSPAQRRLLREVVMTLAAGVHAPGAGLGLAPDEPARVMYFSPDTARIALPAGLPPELERELAGYAARKEALKRELRDRLVALDADRNTTRRVRSLQALADEQAARLAGLEDQAEDLREKLAPLLPGLAPAAPPPLPGALEGRVAAYLRDKSELQRIAQERLAAALAEFDAQEKLQPAAHQPGRRATVVRATVEAFHADRAAGIAALNAEAEAIRSELARHAAVQPGANAEKSTEALLREFADAFKRQQLATLYAEYRTAVLEPGLSPAQRRLLFDGAIADLKLPGAVRDQQVSPDEESARP